jgi:hypothetical protein
MEVKQLFVFTIKFEGGKGYLKLIYSGDTLEDARAKLQKEHPTAIEKGWFIGLEYVVEATEESIKAHNAKVMEGTNG